MGLVPYTAGKRRTLTPIRQSVSDGSTLSLDFTTGVLDPRLTFTRSTNATFINSQGFVQYAEANMLVNSPMQDAANPPSGWTFFGTGGTISTPVSGSRKIATTGSGQQVFTYQSLNLPQGLTFTLSFVVSEITGTINYNGICFADGAASSQLWVNGAQITNFSAQAVVGSYCLIYVPGAGATAHRIGTGANSSSSGVCSMTFHSARVQPGSFTTTTYIPSTLTAAYHAPRFDYDPTTRAPRGLLLEAQVPNLVARSQALNQSPWLKAATSISETGTGSPANDATSNVLTWTNGTAVGSAYTEQSGLPVSASQPYTWSVWLKNRGNQRVSVFGFTKTSANAFSGNLEMTVDFSVATPTAAITTSTNFTSTSVTTPVAFGNGWYRCTMTGTTPSNAAITGFGISNKNAVPASGTNGCEVWGAQLETGSGASSYIPTGASQGSRAADSCVMTGTNFSSWFNESEGTFIAQFQTQHQGNTSSAAYLLALDSSASKRLIYLNTTLDTASTFDGNLVISAVGDVTGVLAKVASAYNSSERALVANGGTVATGSVAVGYSSATSLGIGLLASNSTFKQIKFFPTRLSNSQLQVLTA
jgi:hypothetical protein